MITTIDKVCPECGNKMVQECDPAKGTCSMAWCERCKDLHVNKLKQ